MTHYEKQRALYDELIAGIEHIERKGKTMPYTSANGYMFSQLNKDGEIGIRISKSAGKAFMEEHQASEFRSYGAVMRDYVKIPDHLLGETELLRSLLKEGYDHVMSLPPK